MTKQNIPMIAAAAVVLLLAGALMVPNGDAFALDCCIGGPGKAVSLPSGAATTAGWLDLHRPDGEIVRVKANQIVFVTAAAGTGAATCARSRLQLQNGFVEVRESVEEVMRYIQMDKLPDGT
jgi:hypothetical protein